MYVAMWSRIECTSELGGAIVWVIMEGVVCGGVVEGGVGGGKV